MRERESDADIYWVLLSKSTLFIFSDTQKQFSKEQWKHEMLGLLKYLQLMSSLRDEAEKDGNTCIQM